MSGELHFNSYFWRNFLKNEEAVKFLEFIYRRAGGAAAPDLNLTEISNIVEDIDTSTDDLPNILRIETNRLRHRIKALENKPGYLFDKRRGYL